MMKFKKVFSLKMILLFTSFLIWGTTYRQSRIQVSYNTYFLFDKLAKKLDMMSETNIFAKYQYEMAELQGKTTQWSNVFENSLAINSPGFFTGVYDRIDENYGNYSGIDCQDEVFGGSALTQTHNGSVSTGSEKTQVLLKYNYSGQDGLLANHSDNRSTIRTKINTELYKGIQLDFNAMFSHST